jgi:hypothetical protein
VIGWTTVSDIHLVPKTAAERARPLRLQQPHPENFMNETHNVLPIRAGACDGDYLFADSESGVRFVRGLLLGCTISAVLWAPPIGLVLTRLR